MAISFSRCDDGMRGSGLATHPALQSIEIRIRFKGAGPPRVSCADPFARAGQISREAQPFGWEAGDARDLLARS
jgi:hypothetical protein